MARPRIFVSSTFYDLKQLRADLDRFVRSIGYEAVLNERGSIPYGKNEALEEYCYREIATVDIVVAVIGGRFGAVSHHGPYSISQQEIKTALQNSKPVFVFIQRDVFAELETYRKNKDNDSVQFASVSDRRVFAFIEAILALPNNNPIAPFERAEDITDYLREQWAGLFQRFLADQAKKEEASQISRLSATTETLNQLVQVLVEEKRGSDVGVREVLLTNNPVFDQLRRLTNNRYRVFFTSKHEMNEWLGARGYRMLEEYLWDTPSFPEWTYLSGRPDKTKTVYLHIYDGIFDSEGRLKIYTPSEWDVNWVFITESDSQAGIKDDDIPF